MKFNATNVLLFAVLAAVLNVALFFLSSLGDPSGGLANAQLAAMKLVFGMMISACILVMGVVLSVVVFFVRRRSRQTETEPAAGATKAG